MLVIAHRGACQEALENSWSALRRAVEIGAHRIELDVHLTRDNNLIVIHDETLDRVCLRSGIIKKMTRHELREIPLSNGEPIPFLDEVLAELLPKIELNIEIKPKGETIVDKTMELVKATGMADRVIISSFEPSTVLYLTKRYPEQKTAYLWCREWKDLIQPGRWPGQVVPKLQKPIFHPDIRLVNERSILQARRNNWIVYPYASLHDETEVQQVWRTLWNLQVDGFCTNFPRELLAWIKEQDSGYEITPS